MDEIVKGASQQGFGYLLFVWLLWYVLRTTGEREKNYQGLLNKITDEIREEVKEIKIKIKGGN